MIGYYFGDLLIRGDLQVLGTYSLSNQTSAGEDTEFSRPLGGRVAALFPLYGKWGVGAQFEHLGFASQTEGTTTVDLSSRHKLWQVGLVLTYRPFDGGSVGGGY